MLETIREFSREQLLALGTEADQAHSRHAGYFARLAMAAYTELLGPQGTQWLARLTAEQDNIRFAFRWAADRGDFETALRLATGAWRFYWMRGYLREGLERLETALAMGAAAPPELLSPAMRAAGTLAIGLSDYPQARQWLEQAVAAGRRLPDPGLVQAALTNLGFALIEQGEVEAAGPCLEESLALARRDANLYTVKFPLSMLGNLHFRLGNFGQSRAFYEESLALNRACQDTEGTADALRGLAKAINALGDYIYARRLGQEARRLHRTLNHQLGLGQDHALLGDIARDQGDYAGALRHYWRCLAAWAGRENMVNTAFVFDDIARTLARMGDPAGAVKLMAAAATIRRQAQVKLTAGEQAGLEPVSAACRAALGDESFALAWAEGGSMGLDQAINLALRS